MAGLCEATAQERKTDVYVSKTGFMTTCFVPLGRYDIYPLFLAVHVNLY